MKYILFICLLFSVSSFSQDKTTVHVETAIYKQYNMYKKELYIDNLLKDKIPPILYKNYYKNVMLNNYKEGLLQQLDTINKIQRIFLYTKSAQSGFLYLNKEVSSFMKALPDSTQYLYIQNQDTVNNFTHVLKLTSLKEENIRNLKYKKDKDTFVITIITD